MRVRNVEEGGERRGRGNKIKRNGREKKIIGDRKKVKRSVRNVKMGRKKREEK